MGWSFLSASLCTGTGWSLVVPVQWGPHMVLVPKLGLLTGVSFVPCITGLRMVWLFQSSRARCIAQLPRLGLLVDVSFVLPTLVNEFFCFCFYPSVIIDVFKLPVSPEARLRFGKPKENLRISSHGLSCGIQLFWLLVSIVQGLFSIIVRNLEG